MIRHPAPFRGALRKGHRCGAGMRWTRMALLTRAPEVDGEIVWFRHPKGWCQACGQSAGDGGKSAGLTEESAL